MLASNIDKLGINLLVQIIEFCCLFCVMRKSGLNNESYRFEQMCVNRAYNYFCFKYPSQQTLLTKGLLYQ